MACYQFKTLLYLSCFFRLRTHRGFSQHGRLKILGKSSVQDPSTNILRFLVPLKKPRAEALEASFLRLTLFYVLLC